jgi:hypothetical protein
MRDLCDHDLPLGVVDGVDDAIVADADPVCVLPFELQGAARPGLAGEPVDRVLDALPNATAEPAKGLRGAPLKLDVVRVGRRTLPAAHVGPGVRLAGVVARLDRREAVLEVLDAVEKLGVPVHIQEHSRQATALRDVERVVGLAELVELATELRAEILGGDDSGHVSNLQVDRTVNLMVRAPPGLVNRP